MNPEQLRDLGWQPFFEQQVSTKEHAEHVCARVCAHYGSHVLFLTLDGELSVPSTIVEMSGGDAKSPESQKVSSIAVGDWYLLNPEDYRAVRRLERKTLLSRKAAGEKVKPQLIAANVDTVFIVSSCNQEFNLSRLERYLALVLESDAIPVVVLTKADLIDDPATFRQNVEKLHPGLVVETLDARDEVQVAVLGTWCSLGQTVALVGSSGVGKSTLASAMGGFDLLTATIRADDDQGRHTTTARSMHKLLAGGWLIDNPGMRELQLADCAQGIADLFDDVLQLMQQCKFRNCNHQGDAGCAVKAAVESGELDQRRLANFRKLQNEEARNSASLAERRRKERKTGQFYKSVIDGKKKRRESN